MKSILKRLLARYTVTILWEGEYVTHYARSLSDALSWLACYPRDAGGAVTRNLNGMLVAARRAA